MWEIMALPPLSANAGKSRAFSTRRFLDHFGTGGPEGNEAEVSRRLGMSAETVARIVHLQLADAKDKVIDPARVITHVGLDELSLKKRHKLYVTLLTDLRACEIFKTDLR